MSEMAGGDAPDRQHLHLPFVAASAGVARRAMDEWFAASDEPLDFQDDCRLVVSELVGNAVRHAHPLDDGSLDVDWARSDHCCAIAVTDGGAPTEPALANAVPTDLYGRGLAIVQALSSRWWTESTTSRTTIHAEVSTA